MVDFENDFHKFVFDLNLIEYLQILKMDSIRVLCMSMINGLFRLLGINNNQAELKERSLNHQHQQPVIKRMHHRGYLMESSAEDFDTWKARINGKVVIGEQAFIKDSIDWWCDKKTELLSKKYDNNSSNRKVEVYQNFKLINDSGQPNEWYMLHNGKLYKGTKKAIELKIDIAIKKSRRKQD